MCVLCGLFKELRGDYLAAQDLTIGTSGYYVHIGTIGLIIVTGVQSEAFSWKGVSRKYYPISHHAKRVQAGPA